MEEIREVDKKALHDIGFDVAAWVGSGFFGHVFSGVCNENAWKWCIISKTEAQTTSPESIRFVGKYMIKKSLHGKGCAIKMIKSSANLKGYTSSAILNEASVLVILSHPNIVELYDTITIASDEANEENWEFGLPTAPPDKNSYIIMEYSNGGTLAELIDSYHTDGQQFKEWDVKSWLLELIDGLKYIHSMGVEHGDIKPDNIMFNIDSDSVRHIKYVDFGRAREEQGIPGFANDIVRLGDLFLLTLNTTHIYSTEVWNELIEIIDNMMNRETVYSTVDELSIDLMPVLDQMHSMPIDSSGSDSESDSESNSEFESDSDSSGSYVSAVEYQIE